MVEMDSVFFAVCSSNFLISDVSDVSSSCTVKDCVLFRVMSGNCSCKRMTICIVNVIISIVRLSWWSGSICDMFGSMCRV